MRMAPPFASIADKEFLRSSFDYTQIENIIFYHSKIKAMSKITFSIIITLLFSFSLSAQISATWQGGKPGRSTDWDCPSNWREGRVPDEFTQVIIPAGRQFYPEIKCASMPIDALLMESGSTLDIFEGASLLVLGATGRFDCAIVLGQIRNNGTLDIGEAVNVSTAFLKQVQGNGILISPTAGVDTLARR